VDAGFTVFATGRNIDKADLPPGIQRIKCDHLCDEQTASVFEQIRSKSEHLDLLVNAAWAGYDKMIENGQFTWPAPFWEQPIELWQEMFNVGVRSNYISSFYAAETFLKQGYGLIVNISFYASRKYYGNVIYGVAKAAVADIRQFHVLAFLAQGVEHAALRQPAEQQPRGVGLGIAADDHHFMAHLGEAGDGVLRGRGFPDSTFSVDCNFSHNQVGCFVSGPVVLGPCDMTPQVRCHKFQNATSGQKHP
jgi:hypothetical protein